MKFGKLLRFICRNDEEWQANIIDYSKLKKCLKPFGKKPSKSKEIDPEEINPEELTVSVAYSEEEDESGAKKIELLQKFFEVLSQEAHKVQSFYDSELFKCRELADQLLGFSRDERLIKMDELLTRCFRLLTFTRLNSEGLRKIIKKHDKMTKTSTMERIIYRLQKDLPCFIAEDIRDLIHSIGTMRLLENIADTSNIHSIAGPNELHNICAHSYKLDKPEVDDSVGFLQFFDEKDYGASIEELDKLITKPEPPPEEVKPALVYTKGALLVLCTLALLYGFLFGLQLLGECMKILGGEGTASVFEYVSNPLTSLFIGVLVTIIIQSSSTTVSIIVGMVAGESGLSVSSAIYMVIGANIGTTITALLVSLVHANKPREFARAFAAASSHFAFNWLTAIVLFILEVSSRANYLLTREMTFAVLGSSGGSFSSPIAAIVTPFSSLFIRADKGYLAELAIDPNAEGSLVKSGMLMNSGLSESSQATIFLIFSLFVIIGALYGLVKVLGIIVAGKARVLLKRALSFNPYLGLLIGALVTAIVQSSSITTSTLVPLVGIGALKLRGMYPLVVGCNIGTCVTALLAALVTDSAPSLQISFFELMFNMWGATMFFFIPRTRDVPLWIAEQIGISVKSRRSFALLILVGAFLVLPIFFVFFTLIGGDDWLVSIFTPCILLVFIGSSFYGLLWTNRNRPHLIPSFLQPCIGYFQVSNEDGDDVFETDSDTEADEKVDEEKGRKAVVHDLLIKENEANDDCQTEVKSEEIELDEIKVKLN